MNAGYEPIKIVNWQKALILWLHDKVEVLEFHSILVRSPSASFQLPSVLRLRKYVKIKKNQHIKLTRHNLFLRDDYTCQYCCKKMGPKKLTVDHVFPLSRGGSNVWENVTTACSPCNNKKGSKTPVEAKMPLNQTPVHPRWLPQRAFGVNDDSLPDSWIVYLKHLLASLQ